MTTCSPYKGLEPYGSEDRHLFFGREDDRKILTAKIFSDRVTLFFGVTGAGKSSLLGAGVIPELTDQHLDVVYHFKWNPGEDPRVSLKTSIKETLFTLGRISSPDPPDWQELMLKDFLERYSVFASDPFVIVIDQFEELFLYHAHSPFFEDFIRELSDVINTRNLSLGLVFAMREDFLAELDIFWDKIPYPFTNSYRLKKLTLDQAREAIIRPAKEMGFAYQPELVKQLLHDLSGQHPATSDQHPTSGIRHPVSSVEAPYLQIVCNELWQAEQNNPQKTLTLNRYEKLGGTENIVQEHFERVMEKLSLREQVLAFEMFRYLVTTRRTKMAYRDEDLADEQLLGVPVTEIRPILKYLAERGTRILCSDKRPDGDWYELYHDVFAEIIRRWTEQFQEDEKRRIYGQIVATARKWMGTGKDETTLLRGVRLSQAEEWAKSHWENLSLEEKEFLEASSKKRRQAVLLSRIAVGIIALLAVITGFFWFSAEQEKKRAEQALERAVQAEKEAVLQKEHAERAEKETKRQLTRSQWTNGINERDLKNDPLKACHYFIQVAALTDDPAFSRNAQLAGDMPVKNPYLVSILEHEGPVNGAIFSRDERQVLTWSADGIAQVWETDSGRPLIPPLVHKDGILRAVFSRDERRILTWSADHTARVWDSESGQSLTPPLVHNDLVNGAVFSRDDRLILTWSNDGTARVWGTDSGRPRIPPLMHRDKVLGAVFSQDARQVLTWSADGIAQVWETDSGRPRIPPLVHKDGILRAVFSRDERRILTWSWNDVRMWEASSGQPLTPPLVHKDWLTGAVFSRDERRILTWSADGTAQVWEPDSGQPLTPPLVHRDRVWGAVFSQDAHRILTWSRDGTARMWDGESGKPLTPPLRHEDDVNGPVFSQDERRILTWSRDGTARVWDSESGKPLTPPLVHKDKVLGAMFSQDARQILTWSVDGTARVWDSESGQPLIPPLEHNEGVWGAVFSRDENRILTWSGDGTARVWKIDSAPLLTPSRVYKGGILGAVFSQDARRILTWNDDGTVQVRETDSGALLTPPLKHKDRVNGATFSQDERRILTWSADGTARVWDSERGTPLTPPLEHNGEVNGAIFSQDARRILTWSDDNIVRVWDSERGTPLTPPLEHSGEVRGAIFNQDGRWILTWSDVNQRVSDIAQITGWILKWSGGAARVWETDSGTRLTPSLKHENRVNGATFSQDEGRILTWSADGTARVWDSERGTPLTSPLTHRDEVNGAVFSHDDQKVLTWSADGTARVWDSERGTPLTPSLEHNGEVNGAIFSQDARWILTWSADNTAQVWEIANGRPLTSPLEHKASVDGAVFSQDARRILTWSADGTARMWDSESGQPITPPLVHKSVVLGAVFSRDESRVLTWSKDGTVWVWDLQADYDFPREHLVFQLEVQTGTRLNDVGDIEMISSWEWREKKRRYEEIALEHLNVCKYPRANWFLNELMNRPGSCQLPGEWMREVNPAVVSEVASKYAGICLNWGSFYLNQKKYDQAIRAFETVLKLRTGYPLSTGSEQAQESRLLAKAYERLARTLIESGQDVDKGLEYAQKSLELNPHQQPDLALHTLALGYRQKGQPPEAAEAYLKLGRAYTRWKEYASAVDAYQQALRLHPEIKEKIASEYAEDHYLLTIFYLEQGKYADAFREYEQTLQYELNDTERALFLNKLARDLIDKDIDIDKGVTYAQQSLELDPEQDPELAMDTLALGYIKQGRHAEAVELLEQALEKAPDNETLLRRIEQARKGLEQ